MSVLIKNMEMPTNCSDCPLNYDMMSCSVTGTRWWSDKIMLMDFDSDNERLYDCPLIEIPVPHGRLIDADELIDGCEKLMHMLDPEGKEYLRVFAIKSYLMWAVEYAVIEAEGSKNE